MSVKQTTLSSVNDEASVSNGFRWRVIACAAVASFIYFADIFVRASRKCFWFDELFAVYLCRLPNFRSTWAAVTHGADFNPPLFYLLTRGAQRLFGEGLIATRLPEIVGVWLFCFCLFLFVERRAGALSGFIAGAFPFFTLVQFYAYEARAHGLVLGWCGLALVCWQRTTDGHKRYLWLACFGLFLVAALLTHIYAVYLIFPFALVEIYNLLYRRRPNWGVIAVMAFAVTSVVLAVYLPLIRAYRSSMPATFSAASHDFLQHFLVNVVGPATSILMLSLLLTVFDGLRGGLQANTVRAIPPRELLVAVGFACIPLIGLIGSKVSGGPFFDRYFLPSIAGYAILFGFANSRPQERAWTPKIMGAFMFLLMIGDLGTTVYLRNRLWLIEPSSNFRLSTNPSAPLNLYDSVLESRDTDILVLSQLEYIYLFENAPPSVVPHLYFGGSPNDLFFQAYQRLALRTHIDLKTTTFSPFLSTHSRFLVYEGQSKPTPGAAEAIANAGYRLKSAKPDIAGIMLEYEK